VERLFWSAVIERRRWQAEPAILAVLAKLGVTRRRKSWIELDDIDWSTGQD